MLTAKRARDHSHLNLPLLVVWLSNLGELLFSLLKILGHLLLGILVPLVCLLEVRNPLLHIIKTLVARTYHVLVSLESPSVVVLPLVIACSSF